MLRIISVAMLATALLASPVFAAKSKPAPAAQKCGNAEELAKSVAADGGKIEYNFSGNELSGLNEFVKARHGGVPPEGTDRVIIISKPNAKVWIGIIFVHGCASAVSPVVPESFKKVYEAFKKDGQI